ncbi:unnamed protein product [Caenorhabditis brenneri]
MIIFMAVTVFISEFSYGLMYFANLILQGYEEQLYFEDLNSGVMTLLIFNSIIHVGICFLMSSQYRDTVKGLVCRRKTKNTKVAKHNIFIDENNVLGIDSRKYDSISQGNVENKLTKKILMWLVCQFLKFEVA